MIKPNFIKLNGVLSEVLNTVYTTLRKLTSGDHNPGQKDITPANKHPGFTHNWPFQPILQPPVAHLAEVQVIKHNTPVKETLGKNRNTSHEYGRQLSDCRIHAILFMVSA